MPAGLCVGVAVGEGVGVGEGLAVGELLGLGVGAALGASVGAAVVGAEPGTRTRPVSTVNTRAFPASFRCVTVAYLRAPVSTREHPASYSEL